MKNKQILYILLVILSLPVMYFVYILFRSFGFGLSDGLIVLTKWFNLFGIGILYWILIAVSLYLTGIILLEKPNPKKILHPAIVWSLLSAPLFLVILSIFFMKFSGE